MINWELGMKTSFAISSDNVEEVQELLNLNSYPNLKQEQKEEQIFSMVHTAFNSENKAEKIMKYLIFEYRIKESIAIKAVTHNLNPGGISPSVQKMFDSRNLRNTLNKDLRLSEDKKKALKL
jgi:hypothetical protein